MALNFPDSPTLNQVYTDSTSGFSYQWNGTVWISYAAASTGNIRVLDDISGSFDGVTQTFALTSSGTPISPPNPQSVIVNLGGVVQDASDDYTISGSNIIFSTAPVFGLSFSAVVLGVAVPVGVSTGDAYFRQVYSPVGVQTSFVFTNGYGVGYLDVYQNGVKLVPSVDYTATDGINFSLTTPAQSGDNVEAVGYKVTSIAVLDGNLSNLNVSGNGVIAGTTTLGTVGAGGTTLIVEGNARVTGILTVGTASLTLNGNTNEINGVTISSGIVTASSFVGNVTGNATGLTGSPDITVGVITATSFSGDGSGLTGIVAPLEVSSFDPPNGSTGASYDGNIVITYNVPVIIGVGTITLRTGSETGTIVESFNVQTSNRISVNQAVVTIDPTVDFESTTNYYVVVPAGAFVSSQNNIGLAITTYNFTSQELLTPLFSWGSNAQGRLGLNDTTDRSSPVQIPGTSWSSISGGGSHSLATKTDRTLWGWGSNSFGRLGLNDTSYRSSPVQIPGTSWSSISAGNAHSLATKTDGTLWSWGYNGSGQLGQGDRAYYSSPVQIPGSSWRSISGGNYHSLALKTDGTLWAWGSTGDGQLGQNNQINRSSPVQIPGTTWSSISAGNLHSLATKTDGTLWSWGRNAQGQLGQNDTIRYSSPVQIPGSFWNSISGGGNFSLATKTDGTLWSWGINNSGPLGQNNTTYRSSPVQIPGTTWSSISGGGSHSLATKTDRTLWGWGSNSSGQLGQNNRTYQSSPVQIPGTSWSSISAGNAHSLATQLVPGS